MPDPRKRENERDAHPPPERFRDVGKRQEPVGQQEQRKDNDDVQHDAKRLNETKVGAIC